MVAVGDLARRFEKLVVDNSPVLLTAIGVTGTLTTAYLAAQASWKASRVLLDYEWDPEATYKAELKERFRLTWKLYIPAAATAVLTTTAIIAANRVSSRRAAAVAYSVTEKAFSEYREKVVEKIGEKKDKEIRDEIAQTSVNRAPVDKSVVILGEGRVLCFEEFTGRFFYSDMQALRKAQNDVNEQVINNSYAALSDLYDLLGLPHTSESSEVGWNLDKLLRLDFTAALHEEKPCIVVSYTVSPIRGFARLQ